MKKKKVLIIIIISLLLILSIVGISYALWTLNLTQTGENDIATTCFNISFTEKDNISLQKSYPLYDADGEKLTPYEFTITNNCDSYASYNVNLEVLNTTTLTNNEAIKVMFSKKEDGAESELKLDLLSNYETVTKTLNNATSAFKLVTGYLGPNESKTYDLRVWLDENVTTETVNIQNTTFNSKVVVTANYVKDIPYATNVISKLAKDADSSSTDVYTVPDKTSDTCTYTLAYDGTSDNNLRYVGANPCNYVKIDDEYWRIIGVMNNIDDGTGKKETRVKLIRNEFIGEYSWDSSESSVNNGWGVNEWSQADLMKLLNPGYESASVGGSLYYNNSSGNCYSSLNNATTSCDFTSSGLKTNLKNLVGNTLWNTGSNDGVTYTFKNIITNKIYELERSGNNGKICTSGDWCSDTVTRTTTWNGKIGLMYPSDYGYATSGGSTSPRTSCINKELLNWREASDCYNNDWLYNSSNFQWTVSPYALSSSAYNVFSVINDGSVDYRDVSHQFAVRPSVYLIPSTTILDGEGTLENPYQLSVQ